MDSNPSQTTPGASGQSHLALLYRLSQAFGSSLDLDEVLNRVIDEVISATGAERGFVMLREDGGELVFRVARGLDQNTIDDPEFQVSRSVVERVARDGEPLLTGNAQLDDSFSAATSVMILGLRSILCVPLRVKGEVLGIIYVDNRLQAGMFGPDDLDLLAAIASSAAIAIENARLYAAAQQRTEALGALQRIGLQLTSSLDLSTALDGIAEATRHLVSATDCIIYLYDEGSDWFVSGIAQGAWAEKGQVYLPRREGLTAAVTRDRQPVVIDDAVDHPLFASGEAQQWGIRSVAAYPLQAAGQFLGVVHVVFTEPHAFSQEELRLLGMLADQAAIAVQNARLYEAAQTQLSELAVLHSVAIAGAEATSEDALIERVTQIIGETLFPADVFGVLLLDESARALLVHPSYNVATGKEVLWQDELGRRFRDEAGRIVIPVGQGVTGQVAASGQPARIADVTQAPGYINGGLGTRSELCVPLQVGERIIGVINAESPQADAFSPADERLAATVAGQLATAIEKLRLYEAAQQEIAERRQAEAELRRAQEELRQHRDHLEELVEERTLALTESNAQLEREIGERKKVAAERERLLAMARDQARRQEALFRLSAELAATLDEEEISRSVVQGLRDTLDYDFVALCLLDEATGDRLLAASAGPVEPPRRIPPGQGLSERPLLDGQLHYTPDVTQEPGYILWLGGSEVDVPVPIGDKVAGVLIIESAQHHAFAVEDFEVLNAAAQQAGLALEKARLLAAERRRADEQEALRTTLTGITSELELSALLQVIVERAVGLLEATGGELGLWDEDSQEIRVLLSHNMGQDYAGTRHAPGEGVMGRVAETREPLIISDYQAWEGRAPQYAGVELHGVVAAPLTVGGRLIGAITISDAAPGRRYGPPELHLLNLFAQQAAIAVENSRLYEDLRASQQYARNIIDSSLDPIIAVDRERRIVEFNRAARETFGYRPEEVLGQAIDLLYAQPVDGQSIHNRALDQDGHSREVLNRRKTGEVFPSIVSASPLRDPQGELVGVMGISRDITERKRAEEELRRYQEQLEVLVEERTAELRRSEERYRTLFDGVPVGLYRTTPEGEALDANEAMVQILGYPSRDVLLSINTATLYVEPEERTGWQALMAQAGVVRDFEIQMLKHDGAAIWVNNTARAVRDQQGTVLYYEGSLEDITERKQAEAELERYREHLEELVAERTAELQESEERYRSLFDGVPVGLYRTTSAGRLLDANLAAVQMLGYPRREDLLEVITGDLFADRTEATRARKLVDREGVLRDFESRFKRQDGTLIWADYTAHAVRDAEGQSLYYEGSIQDITKRKQAEEELRQSEKRYRTLFDGVPVGLYRITAGGQILDANMATVQMLGYSSREELLAKNMTAVFARPKDGVRGMLLADRQGIVRDYETRLFCKDGDTIWVNYTARSVRDLDGQVLYYEGSLEDITARKGLEQEIRRQKEYFEALFVGSPVAAMTTDLEANIASWNPMAEKLFGYTQEEAIGQSIDDLVARDHSIREEAVGYTETALSQERVQATVKRTRKDGSLVDVEVSFQPVLVGDRHLGFVIMYHDISEVQQARRAAEEANQAKSLFLANMSHELRTPLNAILGFSQLMEGDANLTVEQQDNLEIINRSGEHLLALINDVLEMSKIEAGRLTLEETSFDLYQLLDSLEEMFRLRTGEKGLALTFRQEADLPRYVYTDEAKLRQVLSNLLGNAVKFTGEGGVVLRVRSEDVKRDAQHSGVAVATDQASRLTPHQSRISFEVEDTGPGIPPGDLQAIFEPFLQATTGQPQEGTGLGLAISRQFAHMMGGDLTVRSELGKGSLFRLDLQVGLSAESEAVTDQSRRRIVGLAPDQAAPGGGPFRLVVAEDRETNRRLLVRLLEPLGFAVKEASDGQEAIEVWKAWRPHLIWMDMRMPVMDGCEATRNIKALPGGQDTIIIALTATAFEEERERILLEGCDDFVRKPFRKEELYDMLARYLGVRFVYEEEPPPAAVEARKAAVPVAEALPAQALAALPAAWRDELRQATVRADLNEILALIDQIRAQQPALATALAGLAQGFDYTRILDLLDEAGG